MLLLLCVSGDPSFFDAFQLGRLTGTVWSFFTLGRHFLVESPPSRFGLKIDLHEAPSVAVLFTPPPPSIPFHRFILRKGP